MFKCECGSMDFDYMNTKENIIICSNCKEKQELNKIQDTKEKRREIA
ncbi:hypothetical protein [Cetobacterium somerae]